MIQPSNNQLGKSLVDKPKQPKQIGDFIVGKTIGEGTFGKVKMGTHIHTKQKVAIKILQKKKISETADVDRVTRQIHILKLIRHPNLVQLYQIIQTKSQLLLIMQYMQNGELFDYIVKNKRIKEDEAKKLFHQIIDGIEYIHKIGVTHRDLKPQNILLTYSNSLKIVDFGLSNTYKKGQSLKTPCGSPCYAAPQMIQGKRYEGIKVDIWSSGIILFAMINGYLPFEDQDTNSLYKKVLSGSYEFHYSVSEQGKDIIRKILNNNPNDRYTLQQIRQHPWMLKFNGRKTRDGLVVGYNKIPVDNQILELMQNYHSNDSEKVKTWIETNRHNQATVAYYLTMKKFIKEGGKSKFDLASEQFDQSAVQPVKRKENTADILIENFFTKTDCAGSTEITHHDEKRRSKLSKQREENKQNISCFLNNKRSKDKTQKKKEKSKKNIKLVLKQRQDKNNVSHMMTSVQGPRNPKIISSLEKKSESQTKKAKLGTFSGKIEKKLKQSKLDNSINYGRVTLAKQRQKISGRESQTQQILVQRQSMIQNRVARKYKEQFNKSLISKSKGKIKVNSQRQRQRSKINNSVNQSINNYPATNYQGFNTTIIGNSYHGQVLMNLSRKAKDHDNSTNYIQEYLTKGKQTFHAKTNSTKTTKQSHQSSKMIKTKKL